MAVKNKLAKTKKNNLKKTKLIKQGVIKKKPKLKKKNEREKPKKIVNNNAEREEESDDGEDMLEMVEKDDLQFIKNSITNRSYDILNRIKYSGGQTQQQKLRKRKLEESQDLEEQYEEDSKNDTKVKKKSLLPIKTKRGVVPQEMDDVREDSESEDEIIEQEAEKNSDASDAEEIIEYSLQTSGLDTSVPITAAQLLAARNETLRQRKIHIGTLSSGVLENPEEKVVNLRSLLKIMDDETPEVFFTVRKLVIVSLLEVFKDILPSYQIKDNINDGIKLKKDTLKLHKFEESLLQYYKKFLQKLEKYCFVLIKKKGDSRRRTDEEKKIGEVAVHAMCDLLVTHPYFNFAQNIAQVIVPFLNHPNKVIREIVKAGVKTIFREDKKEEITLKILRIINHYLKNHAHNVNTDMLEVILVLKLKDVNLDQEKEQDLKQKKLMSHKQNLITNMSKKERKRKKKLKDLEQELLETKAEENKQAKQRNITEITKIVFGIYFRILKSSTNSKVLGVCLEGLSRFSHCINLEYYVDLVNALDNLLKEDWLGYREQLHCIQTVFSILSGQGEALNLDPTRFYNSLYKDLLSTNATRHHENMLIVLKSLCDALIKRRKKITNKRTIGFVKRLSTLSLQLLHNGSLGCLGLIRNVMQLNRSVDILLDLDSSIGDGKFQADIGDPEYANATSTALYEMVLLNKHYHPTVHKFAKNIAYGVPTSGEGILAPEIGKCAPEQLFIDFDMSKMAFNPAVQVPKKVPPKSKPKRLQFFDNSFEDHCRNLMKKQIKSSVFCTPDHIL